MAKLIEKIYCAFCKIKRTSYTKKHIDWTNVLLSTFASVFIMYTIWKDFNPKVLVFFIMGIGAAEIFIQIRWRMSVNCPYCGFDPVLYVKDPLKAAEKVKIVLEAKKDSPEIMLSKNNPFNNLTPRSVPPIERRAIQHKKAPILSKHI